MGLRLTQDRQADALLEREPLALLIGMLLDQQVPMEWAFTGPYTLVTRLERDLDAADIAARDPEEFAAVCAQKPAIHRYPAAMAARIQRLCQYLVDQYGGDAQALWRDVADGHDLLRRVSALPGYGKQKAQILVALLGKQLGVRPTGWREAAGPYGEEGAYRSIADVTGAEALAKVRAFKQETKKGSKRRTDRAGARSTS